KRKLIFQCSLKTAPSGAVFFMPSDRSWRRPCEKYYSPF
ncbi:MAG: hypothetical protein ACI808_000323, partial [Paraglaciecola sp.]